IDCLDPGCDEVADRGQSVRACGRVLEEERPNADRFVASSSTLEEDRTLISVDWEPLGAPVGAQISAPGIAHRGSDGVALLDGESEGKESDSGAELSGDIDALHLRICAA